MPFRLTILGSNSAVPAYNRHPTSQALNIRERMFLIDCGEATQMQMERYRIRKSRIEQIFISHLHGDHYFGLIGLITSMQLMQRNKPLDIFSPPGLQEIIDLQLKETKKEMTYELRFHVLTSDKSELIFETEEIEVYTIPLQHGIRCNGFLFKEKARLRRLRKDKLAALEIPIDQRQAIKEGSDFVMEDGTVVPHLELTAEPSRPRSYAYCSDTAYSEKILPIISGVDLLYHESTFLNENKDRAEVTNHSTVEQAATIAKKAEAKRLLIGHFSAKYKDLTPFLDQATEVFENTSLALEGERFEIPVKNPIS